MKRYLAFIIYYFVFTISSIYVTWTETKHLIEQINLCNKHNIDKPDHSQSYLKDVLQNVQFDSEV